ncbi:MAG: UDPglucose--hexose-1-phosphate uridylyltransferase [Myxococcota bacterium]|jgi:UDPglucose--hexose-1-phosphate uridylyltransferase
MSQLRHDPVQKRWVIIATERGLRPTDFEPPPPMRKSDRNCPFCKGNEHHTKDEVWRHEDPETGEWLVRVVPNRFPALSVEGELEREAAGQYDVIKGIGAHEVFVESPQHNATLADMPLENVYGVLLAWRERLRDLNKDRRLRYILIFKNHGEAAGGGQSHSHSQLIATPITPRTVTDELQSAQAHFRLKERCLFCDILRQEFAEQKRIAYVSEDYVTVCPYASRFPFEMHLFPRVHSHDYSQTSDDHLRSLARHLQQVLKRMNKALGAPAYNMMLHTSPNPEARTNRPNYWTTLEADWHWHIEILPRLRRASGFEWGTGFYINPTAPEDAARFLRECDV